MRFARAKKCLIVLMTGGCMYASVSCYPNRDQINSTISGGLMRGVELAITLAVEGLVNNAVDSLSSVGAQAVDQATQTTDTTQTTG
jgi:hypothetical protein